MSLNHNPSVVINGLVMYYDMANTQKSWKGAPTTNLITNPNPTTVSGYWGLTGASTTANAALAPDDSMTATKLIAGTNAASFQFISPTTYTQPTGTITLSCYMKSAEYTSGSLFLTQSGNNGAVFNLVNGTVTSVTGTGNTAAISYVSNGWWRCSVTNTGGTTSAGYRVGVLNGALTNLAGDGTSGIYVWNAQAEQQSYATPFVDGARSNTQAILDLTKSNTLTAASLTYASDNTFSFNNTPSSIISIPDSNIIKPQLVTISAWVNMPVYNPLNDFDGSFPTIAWKGFDGQSGTQASYALTLAQTGGVPRLTIAPNTLVSTTPMATNVWVNIVGTYTFGGAMVLYRNGVIDATGTGPASISYSTQNFGIGTRTFDGAYQYPWNGQISNVQLYNRALSATEVAQNFNALRSRYGI